VTKGGGPFRRAYLPPCCQRARGRHGSSRKVNKGHGIANIHYLNDGLYKYKPSTD